MNTNGDMISRDCQEQPKNTPSRVKKVPDKEVVCRKKRSSPQTLNKPTKQSRWEKQNEQTQSRQIVPRDPSKRQATRIPMT